MTIEDVLKELLGKYFSLVSKFSLNFIEGTQNENGVRETFKYLQGLGMGGKQIAVTSKLLAFNQKILQNRYDNLTMLGITPQKINALAHLLGFNPETIQNHYDNLERLGITPQKINALAHLLGGNAKTMQDNYNNLIRLGITPQKINTLAQLLSFNPETIQNHYDNLIRLGITPQKISNYAQLLYLNPGTIQDNYNNLRRLGITPQKIRNNPQLLGLNPETIQNHYNNLRRLGITPQNIKTSAYLLARNPETMQDNYRYLTNTLQLEENVVQIRPQLLAENPDSFAKKLRILKFEILGLKRNSEFNPNDYKIFFMASPATLMAKKRFCIDNKINYKNNINILYTPWKKLILKINPLIDKLELKNKGEELTRPYKLHYDKWMGEYRKWTKSFVSRRGRRLIRWI